MVAASVIVVKSSDHKEQSVRLGQPTTRIVNVITHDGEDQGSYETDAIVIHDPAHQEDPDYGQGAEDGVYHIPHVDLFAGQKMPRG